MALVKKRCPTASTRQTRGGSRLWIELRLRVSHFVRQATSICLRLDDKNIVSSTRKRFDFDCARRSKGKCDFDCDSERMPFDIFSLKPTCGDQTASRLPHRRRRPVDVADFNNERRLSSSRTPPRVSKQRPSAAGSRLDAAVACKCAQAARMAGGHRVSRVDLPPSPLIVCSPPRLSGAAEAGARARARESGRRATVRELRFFGRRPHCGPLPSRHAARARAAYKITFARRSARKRKSVSNFGCF